MRTRAEINREMQKGKKAAALLIQRGGSGIPVEVIDDLGKIVSTVTESEPWQLGHGEWVVKLRDLGKGSGYLCSRIVLRSLI